MVRILSEQAIEHVEAGWIKYIEAVGLSTDTKPTELIATGSLFLAIDTSEAYFYDEECGQWIKAGASEEA